MTDSVQSVFVGFLAGFDVGVMVTVGILHFAIKRGLLGSHFSRDNTTVEKLKVPKQLAAQDDNVVQRLNRASELTRIQNEILSQAQQPSQGTSHSKHKNSLAQQYKALEVEKMGVLQSIIKDGHDPLVTVFNATSKQNEEVKLSTFLSQWAPNVPATTNTDPNSLSEGEGIRKVTKKGKTFYVIDGGKKTTQ